MKATSINKFAQLLETESMNQDPTQKYHSEPSPTQEQEVPGSTTAMTPVPNHGEAIYKGSGKLTGLKAIITGAIQVLDEL